MKADFKKWLEEKYGRTSRQANVIVELMQKDINQFAQDYAKKEIAELKEEKKEEMRLAFKAGCDFVAALEFARYAMDFNEWYDEHQKYKDES